MKLTILKREPEVVSALYKNYEFDGEDISVNLNGWLIDSRHILAIEDDCISVWEYTRNGSQIEIAEDAALKVDIHLNTSRSEEINLHDLSRMSFVDFIYRLMEVRGGH
jgi:hypothetical protein